MPFRWRAALAAGLTFALSWSARHLHVDDALIYARYVRNALAGNGLVFNPGERVNALTSPLHTCLLLLSSWMLHGSVSPNRILLAGWLLGIVFLCATALLAERYVPWSGTAIAGLIY